MTSVLLITFLSQARIFLAMARDGLLPHGIFGAVHAKFRTPHISTMLTGVVIASSPAFTPINVLEEMVNIGTLFAFVIVCAAVLILRIKRPDAHRPFRCPAAVPGGPAGHPGQPEHDAVPAGRHLAAAGDLAGHRPGDLLLLRLLAQHGKGDGVNILFTFSGLAGIVENESHDRRIAVFVGPQRDGPEGPSYGTKSITAGMRCICSRLNGAGS